MAVTSASTAVAAPPTERNRGCPGHAVRTTRRGLPNTAQTNQAATATANAPPAAMMANFQRRDLVIRTAPSRARDEDWDEARNCWPRERPLQSRTRSTTWTVFISILPQSEVIREIKQQRETCSSYKPRTFSSGKCQELTSATSLRVMRGSNTMRESVEDRKTDEDVIRYFEEGPRLDSTKLEAGGASTSYLVGIIGRGDGRLVHDARGGITPTRPSGWPAWRPVIDPTHAALPFVGVERPTKRRRAALSPLSGSISSNRKFAL